MNAPMTTEVRVEVGNAIEGELDEIRRLTAATDAPPFESLHTAVTRLADLRATIEKAREDLADLGPEVIKRALLAGFDQAELVGRPYGETTVRRLAREAGLPRKPYGPRPRRSRDGQETTAGK